MKKFGLFAGLLAISALAGGCFGENVPDDVAEAAIEEAKGQNIVTISRKGECIPGETKNIGSSPSQKEGANPAWNNDYLYLTTAQQYTDLDTGKKYTVNIDWSYSDSSLVKKFEKVDDNHKTLYFNYSEEETKSFSFTATLKIGKKSESVDYEVELAKKNIEFDVHTMAELYALNESGNNFELVNENGYYQGNEHNAGEGFIYSVVETCGEVLYTAPDGNWALIGAGNRVLELYAGSAYNLKSSYYPALEVGKSVRVGGEMNVYNGNCQLSYIFYIDECNASEYAPVTEKFSALAGDDFDGKAYYENELMNGLFSASAVYKGNFKVDGKAAEPADMVKGKRATFDAEIDGKKITVAYDYHTDDKTAAEQPVLAALKAKVGGLSDGDSFSIKGTVRYAGSNEGASKGSYKNQPVGTWSIVPFAADHIA